MTERAHGLLVVYLLLVLAVAAGVLVHSWTTPKPFAPPASLLALAFWFFLTLAAEVFWLPAPGARGMISMSLAVNLAVLFVLPRAQALTVAALPVALSDLLLHKRGFVRALFNASQTTIALAAASLAMSWLGNPALPLGGETILLYPLVTLAPLPVFFLSNTALVSGVIALESRKSLWNTWKQNYGTPFQFVSSGLLFCMGLALVVGVESVGYVGGLMALPFLFLLKDAYYRHLKDRAYPVRAR